MGRGTLLKRIYATALGIAIIIVGAAPVLAGPFDEVPWFERQLGRGITWRYYQFDNLFGARQSVSYVEVDLTEPTIGLTIPYRVGVVGQNPPIFPRALTSTMASQTPGARVAINGTYFNTATYNPDNPGATWGGGTTYLKVDGTVVHTFDGTNVNSYGAGVAFNGKDDLIIRRRPGGWASIAANWQNIMTSGPVLLLNGTVETYAPTNDHANLRHPRTAMGVNADGTRLYLLTVDGRTAEAAGMSCTELAQVFVELGCDDAFNLDGGGSTTLWGAGEPFSGVLNFPSDNGQYDRGGERGAANAFVVTGQPATPASWDARLNSFTAGGSVVRGGQPYTVTAVYTNIGTETWTPGAVSIVPSRAFGRTSAFIPTGAETTFFSMNPATVPSGGQTTVTMSLAAPMVTTDTQYRENFALWHATEGYFGPADNELRFTVTTRPGEVRRFIIQGGAGGINQQWYSEPTAGWSNSSVAFTAPDVNNSGTERFCSATTANRSARFSPEFDVPGIWRVSAAFPPSSNSIAAVYTVNHNAGVHTQTINQSSGANLANRWNVLGEFEFGASATMTVGNGATTGNRFYSGALLFEFVGETKTSAWVVE